MHTQVYVETNTKVVYAYIYDKNENIIHAVV